MTTKRGLATATMEELMSELGRRRAFMRSVNRGGGGRPASCKCGKCAKCKKRVQMRKYRAQKDQAV